MQDTKWLLFQFLFWRKLQSRVSVFLLFVSVKCEKPGGFLFSLSFSVSEQRDVDKLEGFCFVLPFLFLFMDREMRVSVFFFCF